LALVKKYGKVFGYFDGPIPNLWITDADVIKAMYVKDFDHFVDRRVKEKKNFKQLAMKLIMNCFFSVFRDKNESHAQMVESNEGTRVEGHSLVRYASLYYGKNQESNFL
jgi:hypothetical protein